MRDLLESLDQLTVEASGEFAEPFYKLQDEFCGGECPSNAHRALIDELVNAMTGDDIKKFVALISEFLTSTKRGKAIATPR